MGKRKEMNLIKGEIRFPGMGQGIITERLPAESPLTRSFNRILTEGKLTGQINYVFFGQKALTPPLYIVGSVCQTEDGRILFFPGVKKRILVFHGSQPNKGFLRILDHLTLDKDFSCHSTFSTGEHLRISSGVPQLEKNLYGWFSFSVSGLSVLEILPKKLEIIAEVPGSDARRRVKNILDARKEAIFHVLHCHDISPTLDKDEFLHIDVFVDLTPQKRKNNVLPSPPNGPPILISQINLKPPFAVRNHKIAIPGFKGILHFLVSKFKGQLKEDAVFKGVGKIY